MCCNSSTRRLSAFWFMSLLRMVSRSSAMMSWILASAKTQPRQSPFIPDFCQRPGRAGQFQGVAEMSSGSLEFGKSGTGLPVHCPPRQVERQATDRGDWRSDAPAKDQRRSVPAMPMTLPEHAPAIRSILPRIGKHKDITQSVGTATVQEVDAGVVVRNAESEHHERPQVITRDQAA